MGFISEFQNMFMKEGNMSDRGYARFITGDEFFADCETPSDCLRKWSRAPETLEFSELQLAIQKRILDQQNATMKRQNDIIEQQTETIKKLLSLHNGSAADSNESCHSSTVER